MYYNRVDLSEGFDLTKSNNSKQFIICHYWFFDHRFKFEDFVSNGRHGLSDIAIIPVKGVDYGCIIHGISKSEAFLFYFCVVVNFLS